MPDFIHTIPEDYTFWLESTGWAKLFEGRQLASSKYASLQPKLNLKQITARPFLEPFTYLILLSRDEKKLARLKHLVDNLIT